MSRPAERKSSNVPDAVEAALWLEFRANRSDLARARIFSHYAPFAQRIARRLFRERNWGDIELADLQQYAFAGLLEAINRYDPENGAPFRPFALRRIGGSIRDGISRLSELREQMAWRGRLQRERLRSLTEPPQDASSTAVEHLSALTMGLALGFMLEGSGLDIDGLTNDGRNADTAYDSLVWKETVLRLQVELGRLPEREQTILRQHYLNGVAFEQLAEVLDLSKGRVSQLHRAALMTLRKRLQARGFSP